MEKKHIIRFLKERKRGVYTLMVEMYSDVATSMAVTMALEIIKEDLEKESGVLVELNYFSLAQAIAKYKKVKAISKSEAASRKWPFKDSHELKENETKPGSFKIN